jgi:hypothetical protein
LFCAMLDKIIVRERGFISQEFTPSINNMCLNNNTR